MLFRSKIDNHLTKITKNINNKIWLINRIKSNLDKNTKILLIKNLIISQLNYCSTFLFQLNKTQINNLTILIKKAIKTILNIDILFPSIELFKKFDLLSPSQLIWRNTMMYIHKANLGLINDTVLAQQVVPSNIHNYNFRNATEYFVKTFKNEHCNSQWFTKGLIQYKNLPEEIINCNISRFKKEINSLALKIDIR